MGTLWIYEIDRFILPHVVNQKMHLPFSAFDFLGFFWSTFPALSCVNVAENLLVNPYFLFGFSLGRAEEGESDMALIPEIGDFVSSL